MKSTVDQIRERFDHDVERFSHLETGNTAQVDSVLSLELIAEAAAAVNPQARTLLDVGCGAGNYSLKVLERLPNLDVTLVDLSRPMLERAQERISAATRGTVRTFQADIREIDLGREQYDVTLAAAVLHHLRADHEWRAVFTKLFQSLRPAGSLWVYDLVEHVHPEIQRGMWKRWGSYLAAMKDESYREHVFAYVEQEDTPKPLSFQMEMMRSAGFGPIEILHKNSCFAAFGASKDPE